MQREKHPLTKVLDILAVVAPIICLVDCIVIPVMLAVLPFIGIHQVWHGVSDQLLAMIAFCICTPAILPGYIQHRKPSVLFLMGGGFALIFLANFTGHLVDGVLHTVLAFLGSCMLIKANIENKKYSKKCCCKHEHHKPSKQENAIEVSLVR